MTYENIKNRLLEATDCGNIECITEFRALSAVVELHKPDDAGFCSECFGTPYVTYPCSTIRAIEKELL